MRASINQRLIETGKKEECVSLKLTKETKGKREGGSGFRCEW
jgi:hypothetical protein